MMSNPFQSARYDDEDDHQLIRQILDGNGQSLDTLIRKHQGYIYNVALKVISDVQDAQDVTQEILIKVLSGLSGYDPEKGRFRTWLYRITFNHILNLKKQKREKLITGFGPFFDFIDSTPVEPVNEEEEQAYQTAVEEGKVACMSGMIMCLDRSQRLTYVIGEVFEIDHQLGAEIFQITPDNFRQKLSRARKDLYQWMHNRCGLVNNKNPCRCSKKTKGFIERGVVDPVKRKWVSDYKAKIFELSEQKADSVLNARDKVYADLFRQHPFKEYQNASDVITRILDAKDITKPLDLD